MRPLIKSSRRRSQVRLFSTVIFVLAAGVGWWTVLEDGPSPARVIAAIAMTAAAVVQVVARLRARGGARGPA